MKEFKIIFYRSLLVIGILLVISIIGILKYKELKDNDKMQNVLNEIDEILSLQVIEDAPTNNVIINNIGNYVNLYTEPNQTNTYQSPYYINYEMIYKKLVEKNQDTIGWLKVNNTKINYPVVQGKNNEYYLNHAFDKEKIDYGWIFVDYRNDMDNIDKNTIIYGHNVLFQDLMFGSLEYVLKEDWQNNPDNLNITFDIKGTTYKWEIFSIYTIDNTNDYLINNFDDDNEYKEFLSKIKQRSVKDFGVTVTKFDKILTLSTCYTSSDDRLVVHARMIG